jgi:hypothetical protein
LVGKISTAAVAIGANAGLTSQGSIAVAVGQGAGANTQGNFAVAIGVNAGFNTQGANAVSIGNGAGNSLQAGNAVAVGVLAGQFNQNTSAIAVGRLAGQNSQGANAIAIGTITALASQGINSIAIGTSTANNQGTGAIAIGANSVANVQTANSIVINASGNAVTASNAGFYVAPVRNDSSNVTNAVYYNTTTKEVTFGPGAPTYLNRSDIAGNITLTLAQGGTYLYSTTAAADTVTIPSNANVAFPVGTTITVVLQGVGSLALTPQANVSLYLGGNSTSTTRTVSPYGIATLIQADTNVWFINGTGVY